MANSGSDPDVVARVRELICVPLQNRDQEWFDAWRADPEGTAARIAQEAGADAELTATLRWLSIHWAAKAAADPEGTMRLLGEYMDLMYTGENYRILAW